MSPPATEAQTLFGLLGKAEAHAALPGLREPGREPVSARPAGLGVGGQGQGPSDLLLSQGDRPVAAEADHAADPAAAAGETCPVPRLLARAPAAWP